ncbi:MAG TPA: DUF1145 domain-containing protein [Gammaproteobacteria bacterium]|nr:DUF1145 domain-containing protein [Gammaproteobacteria bacterium]
MSKEKILLIVLWVFLGINFYLPPFVVGFPFLNYLAIILIVIHIIEYTVFYKRILAAENSPFLGFIKTLIFGLLYIKDLKK